MLLMIDNYDSFTYNIVQYFAELGQEVLVRRNDDITPAGIEALKPQYLVIQPRPLARRARPAFLWPRIQHFAGKLPIMGVYLGHQAIGEAFGGHIVHAKTLMHRQSVAGASPCSRHAARPPNPGNVHTLPTAW